MAQMLGLDVPPGQLLAWYDAIVAGVSALAEADQATETEAAARAAAGAMPVAATAAAVSHAATAAFGELSSRVEAALDDAEQDSVLTAATGQLAVHEIVSDAAVMLFGGIETTEGMICNVIWYLLGDDSARDQVLADRGLAEAAVEEALRLEPAAAVVDRYATADVSSRRGAGAAWRPGHGVAGRRQPRSGHVRRPRPASTCTGRTAGSIWRSRSARISASARS